MVIILLDTVENCPVVVNLFVTLYFPYGGH
jgi:hypothetical protein